MAWNTANATRTRQIASDAARRAGLTLERWLDEAIAVHAAQARAEGRESEGGSQSAPPRPPAPAAEGRPAAPAGQLPPPVARSALEAEVSRIERNLVRNTEETLRALDTLKRPSEPTSVKAEPGGLSAPRPEPVGLSDGFPEKQAAVEEITRPPQAPGAAPDTLDERRLDAPAPRALEPDLRSAFKAPPGGIRALVRKLDQFARASAELAASAAGIATMRAEVAEIRRALADVAPRNAIVALEGAMRDLTQRVEILRQNGHRETLLAPLDAMAAELQATLKAHDPQAVAAVLERDIRAIGAKIESLSESAIKPEALEAIRAQTEEVRGLLAAVAERTAPTERLERQIEQLADRVEQLGASAAPQAEVHRLAAALADLRKEVELRTPLPALVSIEQRLERIAARLDQELQRPVPAALDPGRFEDLARRIDGVREAVQARAEPAAEAERLAASVKALNARLETASPDALADWMRGISAKLDAAEGREAGTALVERRLAEILDKLDRTPEARPAPAVDLRPVLEELRALDGKLAPPPSPPDGEAAERIAAAVARRLGDLPPSPAADLLALDDPFAEIRDRLDALSTRSTQSEALELLVSELLVKLRDTQPPPAEPGRAAELESVAAELSEMRLERAKADQSTEARLKGLEQILDRLVDELAITGRALRTAEYGPAQLRQTAAPALAPAWTAGPVKGARMVEPLSATPEQAPTAAGRDEFLLEPGAGAPKRLQEGGVAAPPAGPSTTSAISAHIAAARRAAQAAAELGAAERIASANAPSPPQSRSLFAGQKRFVVLAAALVALAAAAAVRFAGPQLAALQKPPPPSGAASSEAPGAPAPPDAAREPIGAGTDEQAVDTTPTASIAPKSEPAKTDATAPSSAPELPPAIPAGTPQILRDAAMAGVPSAEFELGSRLFDGRGGLSQDQRQAAIWFERAAQSGLAPAQFRIGALYQKGVGVARDDSAAKRWYAKAAEAGNARAAHNLAVMNAEPADGAPDYAEAAKWFRKAAELGLRDSQFNLGVLYVRGLGVEKDLRQAWVWFSLAAVQGDADAAKKRDEVAAKLDINALAVAIEELAKFRAAKPDPAANQVETPPGGWDAAPGSDHPATSPPANQPSMFIGAARGAG